jgi:TPR repeat protein
VRVPAFAVHSRFFAPLLFALVLISPSAAQDSAPKLLSRKGGIGAQSSTAQLERAAAAGDVSACAELGERLVSGTGMKRDVARALPLLEKAARAGQAKAAFRLGNLLEHGNGVAEDHARALGYFRAAAVGGNTEAYYNVGAAYASGRGVKRDFVEGLAWMILARQHGAPMDGEANIRQYLVDAKRVDWIERGEARAPVLAKELAAHPPEFFLPPEAPWVATEPSPVSSSTNGDSAPPTKSARRGPITVPALAEPHLEVPTPPAGPQDPGPPVRVTTINGRRLSWPGLTTLEREGRENKPAALYALGQIYLDGKVVPADVDRALMYFERGADAGSVDASFRLADIYIHGRLAPMDEKRAFKYMLFAARHGARTAIFNTGALYANGRGTEKNYTEALAWFLVAEKYGADFGAGYQVKDYLQKTAPDQVTAAEHRAQELWAEIEKAIAVAE